MQPICNYPNATSAAVYMMSRSREMQSDIALIIRSYVVSVHINVWWFSGGIYSITLQSVPSGMQRYYNY